MKALHDISAFPEAARKTLEANYGIQSAEAFYGHAVKNRQGMREALRVSDDELDELVRVVEGYLSPAYIRRCRKPAVKRPRGVVLD